MSSKRFRVAFSFAGEKRDFVAEVAAILAKRFGKQAILYDKYHEAEFARYDLGIYLPKLYRDKSDLVVAVLCPDYDKKPWTGWEWMAIHAHFTKATRKRVMLTRFEKAHVDGLFEGAGYAELDDKSPEETAILILDRLALNERKPTGYYYTAAIAPPPQPSKRFTPHNLPRPQSFFGRTEELKQIREALDLENPTWGVPIDGLGGIGKTALAVRAAYDCPPGQFRRIIFLSAKGRKMGNQGVRQLTGLTLPGFHEMLNEIARELQEPEIGMAPEEQRVKRLHDALRATPVLLILDNLESLPPPDRDGLLNFVEDLPQGCKAILTSRKPVRAESVELKLKALDETAALATLADLARHNELLARTNDAQRIKLYRQTGGNPLALRWVAGQLGYGGCRTLTDALRFLSDCPPDKNDLLKFIFDDVLKVLSADETRVLCALTYFRLPATLEHIAKVAGLEKKEELVRTSVFCLANRSLIVPDQADKAFTLVPMVAEFLRRSEPDVIAKTGNGLELRAYAIIRKNGYREHKRFPVLDAAWPILAPALPLFLDGENDRLQAVCAALHKFLEYTGRWDDKLLLSQRAEEKAVKADDHANAGSRAIEAGWVHARHRRAEAVLACAKDAATHWRKAKAGARERATAIHLRGVGHRLTGNHSAAKRDHREALKRARAESADNREIAIILNELAKDYAASRDFQRAERYYREALPMARAVRDDECVGSILGGRAQLALNREDWAEAKALALEALSLAEKLGHREAIAKDCRRIAQCLARQGNKAEGLPYARRDVEISERLGSPYLEAARKTLRECEE